MCSLNLNLLFIIILNIPFWLLLLKLCCLKIINSFLFLLDINMILDFSSLKLILLLFARVVILLIWRCIKFPASLTILPVITSIRSSWNATASVLLVKLRFGNELYWMFRKPGPQQETCGHFLLTSVFILMLLVDKITVRCLMWFFIALYKLLEHPQACKLYNNAGPPGRNKGTFNI